MAATSVVSRLSQYYDDPDTFRPERWLRGTNSDVTDADGLKKPSTVPHFSVLPFGHGPRMCIGRRFAEQEVWLGLIKVSYLLWKMFFILANVRGDINILLLHLVTFCKG